MDRFRLFLELF